MFYWTFEKLQSGTLGVRETWLSIDAGLWLWFITFRANLLQIWGCELPWRVGNVYCSQLSSAAPTANTGLGNDMWKMYEKRETVFCKTLQGEILTWWREWEFWVGLKGPKRFFCCWGAQWILSAHTMAEPEGPSKILQDSPDLEKETLRMQIKTPQNKKNSRSVLLVLDASPLPALPL